MKENNRKNLPMRALDDIPTVRDDAKSIKALVKKNNRVTGYELSDDMIVSKDEAIKLAKAGQIKGVGIAHRKNTEYLKALPDGTEGNNLSNLPTITE